MRGFLESLSMVFEMVYQCNGHTFIVRFTRETRRQCLRSFGLLAADKNVPFSWHDAAVMAKGVRAAMDSSDACL